MYRTVLQFHVMSCNVVSTNLSFFLSFSHLYIFPFCILVLCWFYLNIKIFLSFPECVARVPVSLWGSGGWGCVRSTLRLWSQPSATVRNRSQPFAWGPYGRAYGKFYRGGPFWRFQTSGCFVSRGRRGTSWHSDVFCNVSKVVSRGRHNTFATFSEDVLQFSWQAQHFGRVHRHFSWQAQHFRRVLSRMRSKGSRFTLGVWGLRVCSLDVAFVVATVRNRSQPFATVRVRTVWPCLWEVLQRWSFLEVSDVWLLRFAWQAWHFVTFRRVLQRVESRFAWQAQYFCDVFRRCVAVFVAGAALWACPKSFFVAGAAL